MKINYQIPNHNNQINSNNQTATIKQRITKRAKVFFFDDWNLVIGNCILFGHCNLVIGH